MAVNLSALRDITNLTRATELQKGSWVSLASDLSEFPFYSLLLSRENKQTSHRIEWTVTSDENPTDTAEYSSVGKPLQVQVDPTSRRLGVDMCKVRRAISFARDERELQGTDEEELANIVQIRKAEKLDLKLLSFFEHKLAGEPSSGTPTENEVFGVKYWLPADTTATDLELNGGGNPTNFSSGAADLTVATVPRWAHAVCGYTKVSDDDLLDKLHEFRIRVNYYVPEGVSQLDSKTASRCVLCQHPVFLAWSRLQTVSNDNLKSDLGVWRNAINFMSTPVKWWPVISTPGSAETPTGSGLLYDLDLNTFKLFNHSTFNFDLQTMDKADVPGVILMYREGYCQAVCTNREKNLTAYTTTSDLIVQ